jgi:hypothetical protein
MKVGQGTFPRLNVARGTQSQKDVKAHSIYLSLSLGVLLNQKPPVLL